GNAAGAQATGNRRGDESADHESVGWIGWIVRGVGGHGRSAIRGIAVRGDAADHDAGALVVVEGSTTEKLKAVTMSQEPMRISETDLFDARVEGYLEEQDMIRRAVGEIPEQSLFQKIFYSSYFYLGLAGCVGALVGWGCIEPFFSDRDLHNRNA